MTRSTQVVLSWSGGKDSALALQALRADPGIEVVALLTGVTKGYDRVSIHGVRRELLEAQARAARLPLLEDVRAYREQLLARTNFAPVFPIWGQETGALARRFIADGFVAHLVCVDTTQLPLQFAGRQFDGRLLADLPATVDPCGERGEFHTFVSRAPVFQCDVPVVTGDLVLRENRFVYCDLHAA